MISLPTSDASVHGTSLQGYVTCDYKILKALFGLPVASDGYKTDAEWIIDTPQGVATIYNWEDGHNYLGDEGLDTVDITEWHIGGHSKDVVPYVQIAVEAYKNALI